MRKKVKIFILGISILVIVPVAALIILSEVRNKPARNKVVNFINQELGENVSFEDFSLSFLRHFPRIHLRIDNFTVIDRQKKVLTVESVDVLLNLSSIWKKDLKVEKVVVSDGVLLLEVDSLGNKPRLFKKNENKSHVKETALNIESQDIQLINTKVYFGNQVKSNRTYLTVNKALLNVSMPDSLIILTGSLDAMLDSLISNNTVLFAGQPVKGEEVIFQINKRNGIKELSEGYLVAHTLKLFPRFRMSPYEDGQNIELHISGDGNFNAFLDLFEFNVGIDLEQTNQHAELRMSYNQNGFVNPFLRPYSELDFEIIDGIFSGPNLPFPIRNVHIKGNYNNGENHTPETVRLEIDTLHAEIEDSYVNASLKITNLKDPVIDAHLVSRLDMGHLIKPDKNIELSGIIETDLVVDGKISELKEFHLAGQQRARGSLHIQNLELVINDRNLKLDLISGSSLLNNHILEVTNLVGEYNESAFHFRGLFENLDQYFLLQNENLGGSFVLDFERLDLRSGFFGSQSVDSNEISESPLQLDGIAVRLDVTGDEILTDFGAIEEFKMKSRLENSSFLINSMNFNFQDGDVNASGEVKLGKAGVTSLDADIKGVFKNLNLDFPKGDKARTEDKGKPLHLPQYVSANVDLIVDKGIIENIPLRNLRLIAFMHDDEIELRRFDVDVFEGHTSVDGLLRIDSIGVREIIMSGDLALDEVDMDALINDLGIGEQGATDQKPMRLPEKIKLNMDLKLLELDYKDMAISNFSSHIFADDNQITISDLYMDLPFGNALAELKIIDYRNENINYSGHTNLVIDSLSIDKLMAMKALGLPGRDAKLGNMDVFDMERTEPGLPDNIDLEVNVKAGYLAYKNAFVNDLNLDVHYAKNKIELNTLKFIFAKGDVSVNGYMLKNDPGFFPGYLYSNVNNLDIAQLFKSFDNFGQDKFTYKNSTGSISWAAHYYFELNENLIPKRDANLWILNTNVHKAEFDKVEPIEKTLFFVGHKSKTKMVVNEINVNARLFKDKLYFRDIIMNDNIANLGVFGEVDLNDKTMDVALEISLSDLFFKSKKRRMVETREGIVDLDKDSKLFLSMTGPLTDHKMKLISKRKFFTYWDEMDEEIKEIQNEFRLKNKESE